MIFRKLKLLRKNTHTNQGLFTQGGGFLGLGMVKVRKRGLMDQRTLDRGISGNLVHMVPLRILMATNTKVTGQAAL